MYILEEEKKRKKKKGKETQPIQPKSKQKPKTKPKQQIRDKGTTSHLRVSKWAIWPSSSHCCFQTRLHITSIQTLSCFTCLFYRCGCIFLPANLTLYPWAVYTTDMKVGRTLCIYKVATALKMLVPISQLHPLKWYTEAVLFPLLLQLLFCSLQSEALTYMWKTMHPWIAPLVLGHRISSLCNIFPLVC